MELLYGKPIAERILAETRERIVAQGRTPGLAVVLVGDDAPSHLYVGLKEKAAARIGVRFEKFLFSADASVVAVFECLDRLNARDDIHGIIVQLPLPLGWPTDEVIARIAPDKDADGFHQETLRRFLAGDFDACPVFPRAIVELLRETGRSFHGEKGIVLANSDLLGQVMSQALLMEGVDAQYALSSESRASLAAKAKDVSIIVTACGIPDLVSGDIISEGVIIIDGGISNRDGGVVGDIERASVETKAAYLSPVPGGVGPVTIACLLQRVVFLSEK